MNPVDPMLEKKCSNVRQNSYSPYSKFRVGASIKSSSNQYFVGCNVENISYGLTLCAERAAVAQMISAGENLIKEIYISSDNDIILSPCGACRQIIREFSNDETVIYLANGKNDYKAMSINELLPISFGPTMLNTNKEG